MTAPNATHRGVNTAAPSPAPAPFLVLATTPGGLIRVPAATARAAYTAARHLTEHYPPIRATWLASPHLLGPVAVFATAHPPGDQHRTDQPTVHAVLLTPGTPPGPVWGTLCDQSLDEARCVLVDHGTGHPCPACLRRWTTHHNTPGRRPLTAPATPPRADHTVARIRLVGEPTP